MINGSAPSGAFCRADMAASLSVLYSPTPIRVSRAGGCIRCLSRPAIAGRGRDASWAVLAVRLGAGTRPRSRVMRERQRVLEVTRQQLETSEHSMPEMTADELRAIARELNAYVKLHPGKHEARSLAIRCGEFAALLAAPSAPRLIEPGSEGIEDRVLRIVSGAPLSRREVRVAGIFALVWFAMDGFWFISTLNHWFGL